MNKYGVSTAFRLKQCIILDTAESGVYRFFNRLSCSWTEPNGVMERSFAIATVGQKTRGLGEKKLFSSYTFV